MRPAMPHPDPYLLDAALLGGGLVSAFAVWRFTRSRRGGPAAPAIEPKPELRILPSEPEPASKRTPEPKLGRPLTEGLERTRSGFVAKLGVLLGKKQLDTSLL